MRIFILLALCSFIGCATLFAPQQFSENYARMPGADCDAPEAVDGDYNTISDSTRIVISLPEKKSIRRIIIYSPNISDFILYQSMGKEGDWKITKGVRGNTQSKIVIDTQVTTDKIRIFISDVNGARLTSIERDKVGRISEVEASSNARPRIQEIELYGLVDTVGKTKSKEPLF